ncbi:sigma factor [Cyanobium gracile]
MAVLHRRLRQGVERFDPQRGIRFDTFSYWWIRQGILHSLAA